MFGVLAVEATEFKFSAVRSDRGADPAAGAAGFENIGGGRQVDEMDTTAVPGDMPVVRVTVNVGFDLRIFGEDILKGDSIDESEILDGGNEIVVADDNGGLVRMSGELAGEPIQLGRAKFAGGGIGLLQGIELEPVGVLAGKKRHLPMFADILRCGVLRERMAEMRTVIVVAEGEAHRSGRAGGRDKMAERFVITGLPALHGEVAIDENEGGINRPSEEILHRGSEVIGHVHTPGNGPGIGGDVGIRKEGEGILVRRLGPVSGADGGRQSQRGGGERGALEKVAAGDWREIYRHWLVLDYDAPQRFKYGSSIL